MPDNIPPSCDIADYHMNLTDAQAIAELKKMGIVFPQSND